MRIVIDFQGAQSPVNGPRGIGRYTSSLVEAIARSPRGHEIVLALNGQFPESIEEIKEKFDGLIDPAQFRVLQAPPYSQTSSTASLRAREKLYEAFIASLRPDVVHVTSLFEGPGDASVTSIGRFAPMPTSVTLYDLIPLISPQLYLANPAVSSWYMRKIDALRRADMWLAISESSRREGIEYLQLDPDRCINVSTAAYAHFGKKEISNERQAELRARYGLSRPFIMYTGGIDHRKNLDALIKAFALLPPQLRNTCQLAIVCSARPEDRKALLELAQSQKIAEGSLVVTGFVPEQDLVDLYNLCQLFVFPSWHEGFGLPALEAMHCGAVVIGANTSSLPEVIGREDALFDPRDEQAIAAKMAQGLTDENFRAELVRHGLKQAQKFSWDESARRAIDGFERLHEKGLAARPWPVGFRQMRPRLAYLSPLPPERSGIANYSAELLPELAQHYDIELITDLKSVEEPVLNASFPVRSVAWFRKNAAVFDRVLYHFGNSEFHEHMFPLLAEIPGTVVLHDFFLSGIQAHREGQEGYASAWVDALYASHGYMAVTDRFNAPDTADVVFRYPCNFEVLANAEGIIVHSDYSIELAKQWYGELAAQDWAVVPLLRDPPRDIAKERAKAREELGMGEDDLLVCSFGLLGETKLNHRLLKAWLDSPLSAEASCHLVFVGESGSGSYCAALKRDIASARKQNIQITGWADAGMFSRYLAAADLAVQLRTQSRGETSAAVLDAMGRGVATLVNANGSMASLPKDAVCMLADDFKDEQLTSAITALWRDRSRRAALGERGRQAILTGHAPKLSADGYRDAIERFAQAAARDRHGLLKALSSVDYARPSAEGDDDLEDMATAIAHSLPSKVPARQLLVDVSELVQRDAKSGIQRVVKAILLALFNAPPAGWRIEPVYAVQGEDGCRYARKFTLDFLDCPTYALDDQPLDFQAGDVFVGLDLQPHLVPMQRAFYQRLRNAGVRVEFVVYDLLPILLADRFAPGAAEVHATWLKTVVENDGAICISGAVATELSAWIEANATPRQRRKFNVRSFQLGADLSSAAPTAGLAKDAEATLAQISSRPSFLMVGTVEPRKGQHIALDAFEHLWAEGRDVSLVIAGKQGWMVDALVARLRNHPERRKRLFWIEGASDAYLERLYAASSCLLAASEGEGFGLPLIEAAKHGLPVLVRRLPVFREVAGEHAHYFEGDAAALAAAVIEWLELFKRGAHPHSEKMPYLTWQESAEAFKAALFDDLPSSATPIETERKIT